MKYKAQVRAILIKLKKLSATLERTLSLLMSTTFLKLDYMNILMSYNKD